MSQVSRFTLTNLDGSFVFGAKLVFYERGGAASVRRWRKACLDKLDVAALEEGVLSPELETAVRNSGSGNLEAEESASSSNASSKKVIVF